MTAIAVPDVLRLRGDVITPADAAYDAARAGFNLALDQRPALVAVPADAEDVAAVVRYAAAEGLRVAPQATGHNAGPRSSLERSILLDTSALRDLEIDAEECRARAGAGVRLGELSDAAAAHGLAPLAGSSRTVGVVGYHLGGGLPMAGRAFGLAANRVVAFEVVTAAGQVVRASATSDPDLYWALRGGGGSYAIVTAIELELVAMPELFAGGMFFPLERAREALQAWRAQTETAPEELTLIGRFMYFPDIEPIPAPMRGQGFAVVEAIFLGDEERGRELLRPLLDLGPAFDTLGAVPAGDIGRVHMDPEGPVPYAADGAVYETLTAEAVDALVDAALAAPGLLTEIRHTAGALGRTPIGGGAAAALPGEFIRFSIGPLMGPDASSRVAAGLEGIAAALAPWESARGFRNFTDRSHGLDAFHDAETAERLRAVKRAHDPRNLIHANQEA